MPCPAFGFLLLFAGALLGHGIAPASAAQILPQPAVATAGESGGSVVTEPVPPRARPTTRLVYSCVAAGLVTYADRPCGPAARRHELKLPAPAIAAGAGRAPNVEEPPAAAAKAGRDGAAKADATLARAAADRAATCQRLEASLDEVDSQMRAGYPAREAGRLWERWRIARSNLREARC
jgi:hypothetical protein